MASDFNLGSIDPNFSSFDPIPSSTSNSTPSVESRTASVALFLPTSRDSSPTAVPPLTPPRVSLLRRASSGFSLITNIFKRSTARNENQPNNTLNKEPIYDKPNDISSDDVLNGTDPSMFEPKKLTPEPIYDICYEDIGGFIRPSPPAPSSDYFNPEAPTAVPPAYNPPTPPVPSRPSLEEEAFGFSTQDPIYVEPIFNFSTTELEEK